jgi:hypothetical protein
MPTAVGSPTLQSDVITRGIREFMARDWRASREAKDEYWSARIASHGPLEAYRIAEELRRQALLRDPAWPHADDRREDLLSHLRVAALFDRVDSARRP